MPSLLARRQPPVGLVLCSGVLFLSGLVFLTFGVLFLVAPTSLRDAGFGQGLPLGRRALGLLMFGGAAALFAWPGWGLIRFIPFAREITRTIAVAFAVLSVTRIYRGEAIAAFDWLVVVVGVAMASYLSLPSVRRLFQDS